MELTQTDIETALSDQKDMWDFGNQVLYRLCREHPDHTDPYVVIGKVWLIGRSYAAAIERRKQTDPESPLTNDAFYRDQVAPAFISSQLDNRLAALEQYKGVTEHSIGPILSTHKYLVDVLNKITDQDKRSLVSKYLHFHRPDLFYIYDYYADRGLSRLLPRHRASLRTKEPCDVWYGPFVLKLYDLQRKIVWHFGVNLTPRQLDRLLLNVAVRV